MLNIISLGAGVQSSTMALLAAHGELTLMPDCAVFADTMGEPAAVYVWLDWLCQQLPFPVYRVSAGSLPDMVGQKRARGRYRKVKIPAYIATGKPEGGMISRSCTRDFKVDPIKRKVRELAGLFRKRSPKHPVVSQWIGISTDEADRMKPSGETWRENRWPLIEAGISRTDCIAWLTAHGYATPPKSACVFCPYQSDRRWKSLAPEDWDLAVRVDEQLRAHPSAEYCDDGQLFLHSSRLPIAEIRRFIGDGQGDMFSNECEGVCGV